MDGAGVLCEVWSWSGGVVYVRMRAVVLCGGVGVWGRSGAGGAAGKSGGRRAAKGRVGGR